MTRLSSFFCLALCLVLPARAPAQATPLDIIPADSLIAFAVRDLSSLEKKGDALLKEINLQVRRPSEIANLVVAFMGFESYFDRSGSLALAAVKATEQDLKVNFNGEPLVVIVPFKDRKKMLDHYGLTEADVKDGRVAKATKGGGILNFEQVGVKGRHVYLSESKKAVEVAMKAPVLASALTDQQKRLFGKSDVLVQMGTEAWGDAWKGWLGQVGEALGEPKDEQEREAVGLVKKALTQVRLGVAGLQIDNGLRLHLAAVFPKEGADDAKKFLGTLRGGEGASSLEGLPTGMAVAAMAAKGDGSKNGPVARAVFPVFLKGVLESNEVASPLNRPVFQGLFGEVWERLRGSRLAVYKTSDEKKWGLFAVVAILETDNPAKLLVELRKMARLGHAESVDLGKEAGRVELEQLIKELGDPRFRIREAATVRLLLVGEPALQLLEKAEKSDDAEIRRRAAQLRREIGETAEARRKELLAKGQDWSFRPSFRFQESAEKFAGHHVEVVHVGVRKEDVRVVPHYKQLLGPEWDRVRLVVHKKRVVVLLGSDVRLLLDALANLDDGKPGLAASPALGLFRKQADAARKIEFHLSLRLLEDLVEARDLEAPAKLRAAPALTSFGLTVEPDRLQLDVHVPIVDCKTVLKKSGL